LEIFQETGQGDLGLVQHQMVYLPERFVFGREKRTAGDGADADCFSSRNHFFHRFFLDGHCTHKDEISPPEIIVQQAFHVHVDQFYSPRCRKHCGNSQQSEWRTARLSVNKFQCILEAPEGIREFRINEKCFHGTLLTCFTLTLYHESLALQQ
jgi:hypothetical protein